VSLKRSLFSSTLMRVVSAALTFLYGVVLARLLGPDAYGHYVQIFSWISLGYFLSTAGLPVLVLRETALSNAAGEDGLSKGVLLFAIGVFLALLAICGLAYTLSETLFGFVSPVTEIKSLALITVLLWGLSILFENATRGMGHTTLGQLAELILRPGLGIVTVLGLLWTTSHGTLTETDAIWALLGATLATCGFSAVTYGHVMRQRWSAQARVSWRAWIHGTALNSTTSILIKSSFALSFLLIGYFVGPSELGIYRVNYQLTVSAGLGLLAAKAIVAPQIARAGTTGETPSASEIYRASIRLCLMFSLPIVTVLLTIPDLVVATVYGEAFIGSRHTLQILAFSVLINSVFGPIDVLLQVRRRDFTLLFAALLRVAVLFGLILILTPIYGIAGSALAYTASITCWCVVMLFGHHRSKLNTELYDT